MKRIYTGKINLISFLFFLLFLSYLVLPAFAAEYDVTCNQCGHDNPQWLEEDTVHYCESCGALGMPMLIDENESGNATSEDNGGTTSDDDGLPFVVVIGGAAVAGAIAIILGRNAKKKKKADAAGYILKLSQHQVYVTSGAPAQVIVTVLRVDAQGRAQIEPSAPIYITLTPDSVLQVLPPNGYGEITLSISQKASSASDAIEYIDVAALVPGAQKNARIAVNISPSLQIVFF